MATSTTTTCNDIVNTEAIEPVGLDYLREHLVVDQLAAEFSLEGKSSATLQLYRITSILGTVGDGGASVDTEFDVAQDGDLSSVAIGTDGVTIAAAEYGLNRTIRDSVFEDNINGQEFAQMVMADSARVLATALEDDYCSLFVSFNGSTAAGTTETDLSLADLSEALVIVRNAGVIAPDGGAFVLDPAQVSDYEAALVSANAAALIYAGAGDRFLGVQPTQQHGMANGQVGWFRNQPMFQQGLCDTVNVSEDVAGWFGIHDTPGNRPYAAIGKAVKRPFRMRMQRDESLRATEFISSMRVGVGELQDGAGVPIETDA